MKLTWIENGFESEEYFAPFTVNKDCDYFTDLQERYNKLISQAKGAGADDKSIAILEKYKRKILEALNSYYEADIAKCNSIIKKLISKIRDDSFASSSLLDSYASTGAHDKELQLFRGRTGNPSCSYKKKDMLYLPREMRAKSGNYRFSIPGNPSWYLANSSYGCWIETGFPSEENFNVSPVLIDGTQRIFNLAISIGKIDELNEFDSERVHCWLKLLMLMIATSYRVEEENRIFKSEYIISQAIMMACMKLGYDGVAYFSKRVSNEIFAYCAINLALFVRYDYQSKLLNHIKIDDPFNYSVYKQLLPSLKYKDYDLRTTAPGKITNIGSFDRQYPYSEIEYSNFDKFLFTSWRDKPNGCGKDEIPWGVCP